MINGKITTSHINKFWFQKIFVFSLNNKNAFQVGCVPAARWPYAEVCFLGRGVLAWGVCSQWGSAPWGGCLLLGGLLPGGVCSQGGLLWGGVCSRGGYIPACTEADTPPPLWTDRHLWKYYLGPTSLRPVKILMFLYQVTFVPYFMVKLLRPNKLNKVPHSHNYSILLLEIMRFHLLFPVMLNINKYQRRIFIIKKIYLFNQKCAFTLILLNHTNRYFINVTKCNSYNL